MFNMNRNVAAEHPQFESRTATNIMSGEHGDPYLIHYTFDTRNEAV
jgi:hypothetical protein